MQNITISGNLISDARLFNDQSGKEYMSFRVAVNDIRKGEKNTTYYDVTASKTGVMDYPKKGQGVIVSGKLTIEAIDKDGKSFVNINVFARDLELYGQQRANA